MSSRYSTMKIFHFAEKLDSLLPEVAEIQPPIHIRIKPTNVCNHHCWYCAYRTPELQLGKDMVIRDQIPREKMAEIVADVAALGVKAVTFSGGGDPFVYPYLLETARRLADSPVRFASLTNGARLCGEVAEVFAHNATWVRVSIDGWDDESYAKYRNTKIGEFSKVVQNIEAFARLGGGCHLGVSVIVDRGNAGHVLELVRRLKDAGVASAKVSPCIVSNDRSETNAYHANISSIVEEQIRRAKEELAGDGFDIHNAYHAQLTTFAKEYSWCPYLQILPVIGADLNVYSCQDKAYNLDSGLIGSIKDRRFADFWMADKSKFFRIDPSRDCNHHCVAHAKNQSVFGYLEADPDHLGFV
ncbi:MAG: radical SAM protein [Candidatus Schekmanbacteria bacterium]|nr:radical SAM protein [Candidatus Schekmanbacteria bacterium]